MIELFEKYKKSENIENALIVGRNLFNRNPDNIEIFTAYFDFLLYLGEKLPALEERKFYINQADIALAFFTENVDISEYLVDTIAKRYAKLGEIKQQITTMEQKKEQVKLKQITDKNQDAIKKLYDLKESLRTVKDQKVFDDKLKTINELDNKIDKDVLSEEQKVHYDALTKDFSALISKTMQELEYQSNIEYNSRAVKAYKEAFDKFQSDENKYKNNMQQLFDLALKSLFAYDAAKLFNETLIYYNHIYSYIFSKLDEQGKFQLTKYSIECERKLRY